MPEKRVREYSIQQSSEIEPQITELLQLAEKSVKSLERKEASLRQKVRSFVLKINHDRKFIVLLTTNTVFLCRLNRKDLVNWAYPLHLLVLPYL